MTQRFPPSLLANRGWEPEPADSLQGAISPIRYVTVSERPFPCLDVYAADRISRETLIDRPQSVADDLLVLSAPVSAPPPPPPPSLASVCGIYATAGTHGCGTGTSALSFSSVRHTYSFRFRRRPHPLFVRSDCCLVDIGSPYLACMVCRCCRAIGYLGFP